MKVHNKLLKSKTVTEKTDLWGNFITTILTRTGLHPSLGCYTTLSLGFLLSLSPSMFVLNFKPVFMLRFSGKSPPAWIFSHLLNQVAVFARVPHLHQKLVQ